MAETISLRLPDQLVKKLTALRDQQGGSMSDVVRKLLLEALSLQAVTASPRDSSTLPLVHECSRYTASLLTALVRKSTVSEVEAEELIQKAIADAAQVGAPVGAQDPEAEED